MKKFEKAQASLEFILVLTAFISMLLLFVPAINNAFALAKFGLESQKAKAFAIELKQSVEKLSIYGIGSKIEIEANPSIEWNVSTIGKKLSISLKDGFLNETKVFTEDLALEIVFPIEKISKKTVFSMEKTDSNISIEYNNP